MSRAARTLLNVALAMAVAVACLNGCRGKEKGTVKIGAITPLTGAFAAYGEPVQEGILLAVDRSTQREESAVKDQADLTGQMGGDPKNAVNAFTKLATVLKSQ